MGQDCKYCGAYIAGRADECPACGKRVSYKAAAEGSYAYEKTEEQKTKSESGAYTYKDEYEKRYGGDSDGRTAYTKAETRPAAAEDEDVKQNKLITYLCYFGPLFLIPYLMRPGSAFVKFHANQGLVLLVASIVGSIISEFVPGLAGLVGLVVDVLVFVGFIKGLINVNKGIKAELPIIGGIRILR